MICALPKVSNNRAIPLLRCLVQFTMQRFLLATIEYDRNLQPHNVLKFPSRERIGHKVYQAPSTCYMTAWMRHPSAPQPLQHSWITSPYIHVSGSVSNPYACSSTSGSRSLDTEVNTLDMPDIDFGAWPCKSGRASSFLQLSDRGLYR